MLSSFKKIKNISVKNDHFSNIATNADLESEKKIISIIKKKFPDHDVYSEEIGRSNNSSEYLWVIDPLDGTIIFANGFENFGISIALLLNKKPIMGVIYLPFHKKMFFAENGKGAFLNGRKIIMKDVDKINNSVIAFDCGYIDKSKHISETMVRLAPFLRYPLMLGSAVFAMSCLVENKLQGYVISTPTKFDIAAGFLIIKEAGGIVTDFKGQQIDWSKRDTTFLASCPGIHKNIIEVLNKKYD